MPAQSARRPFDELQAVGRCTAGTKVRTMLHREVLSRLRVRPCFPKGRLDRLKRKHWAWIIPLESASIGYCALRIHGLVGRSVWQMGFRRSRHSLQDHVHCLLFRLSRARGLSVFLPLRRRKARGHSPFCEYSERLSRFQISHFRPGPGLAGHSGPINPAHPPLRSL